MTVRQLILRSLAYYWRTNVAVILGVGTAVAVLSGALLVGDSVRGSLRALVVERLGQTQQVVLSTSFLREKLAEDIQADSTFAAGNIAPMILAQGFVSVQSGEGRAGKVAVYGVDERFWRFHGVAVDMPGDRDALLSPSLAAELQVQPGATILVRTQRPSDIPMESLQGRKNDAVRTLRATVRSVLPRESLGEFSLQAQQGAVRAVFLPLALIQRELGVESRVNALLVSDLQNPSLEILLQKHATLEDLGLSLRILSGSIALESASGLLDNTTTDAALAVAAETGVTLQRLFTYLANTLRVGNLEIPYSVVTAIDSIGLEPGSPSPIALSDWAARDLNAKPGDTLSMEYFLWEEPGQLVTRTAEFRVDRIVPISTGDSEMTPTYPGITNASTLRDWDPPFPVDLKRVRPVDEAYWDRYSTTPKAFIPFQSGQQLWSSRHGILTSVRFIPPGNSTPDARVSEISRRLRERIDPLRAGLIVQDIRSQSLDASRGATNFGEYFVYFSFFLVVSAILLSALFFKLSVEQRIRDVGLLRAVGISSGAVRRVFLGEGLCLSLIGAVLGVVGGILYASGILWALRTWWVGAVGTETISLHVTPASIVFGAIGGIIAALVCIALTLRSLRRISERALLAGELEAAKGPGRPARSSLLIAVLSVSAGILLMVAGMTDVLNQTAAFFGSGLLLLTAVLFFVHYRLSRPSKASIGPGAWPLPRLGFRNVSFRPVRSVVALATIASATFILIAVDSFRKGAPSEGFGGYAVMTETLVPIVHDPNTKEGQDALGLTDLESVHFETFRIRPGDDASCLNLYEPKNPRILAPSENFVNAGRFSFQSTLASNAAEQRNPWVLLHRKETDGAIPVIADANSMTYVLHRKLGEDFVIINHGQEVRLRFVAALTDSIFQSELLMSQENFLELFPEQEGYSFLLAESSRKDTEALAAEIENALAAYGADATPSAARLAEFHRVENTYLSTFQMLGGLGLLLGTIGLAAVLLRSIFERRRELALLRALGYGQKHFFVMTLMENVLLLGGGLLAGTSCALLAIAPAATAQGGRFPTIALAILLGVLFLMGVAVSLVSTRVALREAVLQALRSE